MKCFGATTVAIAATLFLVGDLAQAEFVVGGYCHMGEADTGAAAGLPGNTLTLDSSGQGKNLTKSGTAAYSSNVAASAYAATGSTLSMDLTASHYNRAGDWTTCIDNFILEGWFKVANTSQQALVYNGCSDTDGYGIYLYDGTVRGLYGNVAFAVDSGFSPTANEWFYAALVRDGGVAKMFINDGAAVTGIWTAPAVPTASFTIGGAGVGGVGDNMTGSADEVRLSVWSADATFNTDMLLISQVPEPSAAVIFVLGAAGLLAYAWRKRK